MAISIVFDEEELNRDYTEVAVGGPVFDTGILGNPLGMQQRAIRRQDAIRSWDIQFEGLSETQKMSLEEFFITKYGGGIGFRFFPPSDNTFRGDVIGTGTGSQTVFPLYRKYVSAARTISRRIVKPIYPTLPTGYSAYVAAVNGTPVTISTISQTAGTMTLASAPGNGTSVTLTGGAYCVPVVFELDNFETSDYGVFANLDSIRVTELLPAALGLT